MNLADVCNMVSYMETFAPYTVKTLSGILSSATEFERLFHHYGKFMLGEREFLIQNGFTIEDLPSEDAEYPQHTISWDRKGDERYKKEVTELMGWKPYFIDEEWLEQVEQSEKGK